MSKPLFMKFNRGQHTFYINMNLVSEIHSNRQDGTILYFPTIKADGEQMYVIVDQSVDEIGNGSEWRS